MKEGKSKYIDIDEIKIDDMQSRMGHWSDDEKDDALVASMKGIGQVQDVIVRPLFPSGKEKFKYGLVAGSRRYHALIKANKPKIRAIVILTGAIKTLTFYMGSIYKRLTIMPKNTRKLSKMQKEILKIIEENRPITQRKLSIILSKRLGKRDKRNLLDEADKIADERGITNKEERWRLRHHYLDGRKKRKHDFQTDSFRASFSRSLKRLLDRKLIGFIRYEPYQKNKHELYLTDEGKNLFKTINDYKDRKCYGCNRILTKVNNSATMF